MLVLKPLPRDGRSMVHPCGIPPEITFILHPRFSTLLLAYVLDSLVRVSRRVDENHCANIPDHTGPAAHPCNKIQTTPRKVSSALTNMDRAGRLLVCRSLSLVRTFLLGPSREAQHAPSIFRRSKLMLTHGSAWCSTLRLR